MAWSDDITVVDAASTDATAEIARNAGATILQVPGGGLAPFGGNEAALKNEALATIRFKYPWVLHLDADECATPELVSSIRREIAAPTLHVAYNVRRRDYMGKTWLRHVQASSLYLRVFMPGRMRFERPINPVSVPNGPVATLDGCIDHFPFSKGIRHWVDRHNAYSDLEAKEIHEHERRSKRSVLTRDLMSRDFHVRRAQQKRLFYHMPGRPLLKFLLLYIAKAGFLDGEAGLTYALLQAFYEYMIVLKVRALSEETQVACSPTRGTQAITGQVVSKP